MQSRITIEVDFDNGNNPVIQIVSRLTDDVRDKLIRSFFEALSHDSSWCKVTCEYSVPNEYQRWYIRPIGTAKLKEEGEYMLEQHRLNLQLKQS